MIMFSKSNQELDNLINSISKSFKITELTNRNLVFLGLEIKRLGDLFITQRELIRKLLQKFKMSDCKMSQIPMQPKLKLAAGNTN